MLGCGKWTKVQCPNGTKLSAFAIVVACRRIQASNLFTSSLQKVELSVVRRSGSSQEDIRLISAWIAEDFPALSLSIKVYTENSDHLPRRWPSMNICKLEIVGLATRYPIAFPKDYLDTCPPVDQFAVTYMSIGEMSCSTELRWKKLELDTVVLTAPEQFVHMLATRAKQLQKLDIVGECIFQGWGGKEEFVQFLKGRLLNVTVKCLPNLLLDFEHH